MGECDRNNYGVTLSRTESTWIPDLNKSTVAVIVVITGLTYKQGERVNPFASINQSLKGPINVLPLLPCSQTFSTKEYIIAGSNCCLSRSE